MNTKKSNRQNALLLFFVLSPLMLCLILPVWAMQKEHVDPKMAKQYIAEILSQPEFKTTREEYQWRYIGKSSIEEAPVESTSSIDFFRKLIAQLFELLLWILLGTGIILFVIYGSRWLEQMHTKKIVKPDYVTTPPRLVSENTTNLLLPTNISQQAWLLWQSGDVAAAISLLYRGALSALITRDRLDIDDSTTESECLHLVKNKQSFELYSYFAELTSTWQNIAYAKRLPSENKVQKLCKEWELYFGKEGK